MSLQTQPIRSGLMNGGYVVADKPRLSKDEAAALIARMRAYDSEMVTGIFQNLEAPGSISICMKVMTMIPMNYLMENGIVFRVG